MGAPVDPIEGVIEHADRAKQAIELLCSMRLAFVVALLCAGVMGYAIQRGATCTVAAVDEVVTSASASAC